MEGHKFIKAMFSNDEKNIIESYWQNENDEVRVEFCPAEDGDEVYEMVKQHVDIETLHDETYEHIKAQDRIYREAVLSIAKQDGYVWDIKDLETDNKIEHLFKITTKAIFEDADAALEKEKLFLYKLQLFELDKIKDSKDSALKKQLRQAKTVIEATKIACEFY
jgi:hypothetical protein